MRTWIAALVLVLVVTAAITVKLLVRRRAPMGGWFTDSPRSAGTLSVIGTMFAVMLAFVILLALQSYQRAKEGSNIEAIAVAELDSIAEVFESPSSDRLHGGLVCYARAVVEDEWPAMGKERSSELVQSWIDKLGRESATAEPPRRAAGDGLQTVVGRAGAAPRRSARAAGRGDDVCAPPAVVRSGPRRFRHDRLYVRAGRPARGGPYPVDTNRLLQRPRDRGSARGLLPRPSVRKRERQHHADRNAPDAHAH